jgi:acetyl-CoA carboxylase biotin carboxylase subunit
MFQKILVANRGEIALRVIAACKELGIDTVAVHSEADREALHVQAADESVCIGPPAPSGSYLNITNLVAAAEITGADAVHPGYGFLAENAHFAEILEEVGLTWIGPSPDAIRRMGDKAVARDTMRRAKVATVPGSPGPLDSVEDALAIAGRIGYPVLLKAVAGGGGRGMRVATTDKELAAAFELATSEAERAFGNGSVYLEKYLAEPRHVEFQVFGDQHGNVVHLGERECSLQRRHQKVLEESPSPAMTRELRAVMGEAAVAAARAVDYVGAGTVEFLLDSDG